ncbi:hypothetical protein KJ780_01515, partial [Candidatus Micrarchaeota archaeon]|nr:hypothetical protein [Candidatus Micrarchaeota archaeon]
LESYLDGMKSCYVTVMYSSCYSGAAGTSLAGKGRTIITSTDNTYTWGFTDGGAVFTKYFIEATSNTQADANNDGSISQKEAFDLAKKKTSDWAKSKGKRQEATYTSPEKCRCCHVICDSDYICKAVDGDGTDSPLCPRIGDYCGTEIVTPPEDGNGTEGENVTPSCGDGLITSPEECDYRTYGLNICEEGKYCKDDCMCHDLETSVGCGDGKISYPQEECDGRSVYTDVCPSGFRCEICKCKPIVAVCGNSMIDPGEDCDPGTVLTKTVCDIGEVCQGCKCISESDATHKECVDDACVSVSGYGEDSCNSDSQCAMPKHLACIDYACVEVQGQGNDQCVIDADCEEEAECGNGDVESGEDCEYDSDCNDDEMCVGCSCVDIPAYCGDGNVDAGEECEYDSDCDNGVCGSGCKCVYPPTLDCEDVCGDMGLPIIIGHGYPSASECAEAAREDPTACFTTCIKSGFYRVDNIAGWDSCCCKKKTMYECSDCPGQNPQCPDCPAGYQ